MISSLTDADAQAKHDVRSGVSSRSQEHCRIGIPQRPHRRCSRRKTVPQLCGQGRILPYNARGDEKHHEAAVDTVYKLLWLKQNDLEKYGKRRRTTVLTSDEVVSTSFVNGHDLLSGCVCYWVESSAAESFNPRFQGNNSAIRLTGWSAMRSST